MQITITFSPETNPDLAAVDVQNRLKRVEARLPAAVTQQGVQVTKSRSNFLLFIGLSSTDGKLDPVALVIINGQRVQRIARLARRSFRAQRFALPREGHPDPVLPESLRRHGPSHLSLDCPKGERKRGKPAPVGPERKALSMAALVSTNPQTNPSACSPSPNAAAPPKTCAKPSRSPNTAQSASPVSPAAAQLIPA